MVYPINPCRSLWLQDELPVAIRRHTLSRSIPSLLRLDVDLYIARKSDQLLHVFPPALPVGLSLLEMCFVLYKLQQLTDEVRR